MVQPIFQDFPHTCVSCGLLGIIDRNVHGRPLVEYNAQLRAQGRINSTSIVWCLRRAEYPMEDYARALGFSMQDGTYALADRENRLGSTEHQQEAMRTMLQQHRAMCQEQGIWIQYEEYFSPKEHYEWWRMLELEKLRQQQQETMASIVKEQTRIAADHAETAKQHAKIADTLKGISQRQSDQTDAFNAQTTRYNLAFLVLAVIAIILALAPLAYPAGASWLTEWAPGANQQAREATPTPILEGQ